MKDKRDILDEAVDAVRNESVPPGPLQETIEATMAKLAEGDEQPRTLTITPNTKTVTNFFKAAVAAVLLIGAGYAIGQFTANEPVDMHALETSLKSSLEPAIRRDIAEQLRRQWTLELATNNSDLKDELRQQFRQDLNSYALQTLAASNAATNQRLADLTEAITAVQTQQQRWVTAALGQIELKRLQDKTQLMNGLETLAVGVDGQLRSTKENVALWVAGGCANPCETDQFIKTIDQEWLGDRE